RLFNRLRRDGPQFPCEGGLARLILGEHREGVDDDEYGNALEAICLRFGQFLPNDCFCPMGAEWPAAIDKALKKCSVAERAFRVGKHLLERGAPVRIPKSELYPLIGYLKKTEILRALKQLQVADFAQQRAEIQSAVAQVRSWLEACRKRNCDLI